MSNVYGSWAQWRRRVKRSGGEILLRVHGRDAALDAAWEGEHVSHLPRGYYVADSDNRVPAIEGATAIADRRAG